MRACKGNAMQRVPHYNAPLPLQGRVAAGSHRPATPYYCTAAIAAPSECQRAPAQTLGVQDQAGNARTTDHRQPRTQGQSPRSTHNLIDGQGPQGPGGHQKNPPPRVGPLAEDAFRLVLALGCVVPVADGYDLYGHFPVLAGGATPARPGEGTDRNPEAPWGRRGP